MKELLTKVIKVGKSYQNHNCHSKQWNSKSKPNEEKIGLSGLSPEKAVIKSGKGNNVPQLYLLRHTQKGNYARRHL